jgi:hypothetical protein
LLVFVKCRHSISIKKLILKSYTKFKFKVKQANKKEKKRGVTARQTRWHRICKTVAPFLGSVLIPLRRRQSGDSGDFSKDSGLSRNSGASGIH